MNRLVTLGVCALGAFGCASEEETAAADDPAAHACERIGSTGTAVTAGDSRATAAEIAPGEEPYTLTLVAGAPSFVKIPSGEDALLFTKSTGVVSALYHEQETTNLLAPGGPNDSCPNEIPEHFDLELEASGTYYLELAASVTPSVWIALTRASGHGGH